VIYCDATLALLIGTTVTSAFLIAGAGILRPRELPPADLEVATTLSSLFSGNWGGTLFMLGGAAALLSTLTGQFAGWPRLVADGMRICLPAWGNYLSWRSQFRIWVLFFLATNMLLVYTLGYQPVALVQFSAVFDGLLLTPFQAIWVLVGLYWVLPKLLSREAYQVVRPGWPVAAGLIAAAVIFTLFCLIQLPLVFASSRG
jgi:hypothetical protein